MKVKISMKFYDQTIFPWLLDHVMGQKEMREKRKEILKSAEGKILEIGIGTGLNLEFYPKKIKEIFTIEVNAGMSPYLKKRSQEYGIKINSSLIKPNEKLPFPDENFASVLSTWTLCSIKNLELALKEIHRVLKKEGKFIFIEHHLSSQSAVRRWQEKLTPWWKKFAGGCHLNRDMKKEIEKAGFKIIEYKDFEMEKMNRLTRKMCQGIAFKK